MNFLKILFSFLLIFSMIMTIQSFNMIYSMFWLIFSFINSSLFLFSMKQNMMAMFILIIYAGAMTMMFMFAMMMLNLNKFGLYKFYKMDSFFLFILMFSLFLFYIILLMKDKNLNMMNFTEIINMKNLLIIMSSNFYFNWDWALIGSGLVLLMPMLAVLILI